MALGSAQYRVTLRSMILRGTWLHAVWYCVESISKKSKNLQNLNQNRKYFKSLLSGPGSLKLWKKLDENLAVLSLKKDTEKSHDSSQYGTAQYDTLRGYGKTLISRQKRNQKGKYFNPLVRCPGRFQWWKKTGGSKISLDCPFKEHHLDPIRLLTNFISGQQILKAKNGGIRVFKVRIGEKTWIHPDPDPKHCHFHRNKL